MLESGLEETETDSRLRAGFGFPVDVSVLQRFVELSPAPWRALPAQALSGSCDVLWSL